MCCPAPRRVPLARPCQRRLLCQRRRADVTDRSALVCITEIDGKALAECKLQLLAFMTRYPVCFRSGAARYAVRSLADLDRQPAYDHTAALCCPSLCQKRCRDVRI